MLIVCPSCATSYDVKLASLGPQGRSVRCLRCHKVWRAAPSRADSLLAAAQAIGSDRAMADAVAGEAAREFAAESPQDWAVQEPVQASGGSAEESAEESAKELPEGSAEASPQASAREPAAAAAVAGAWFEPPADRPRGGEERRKADIRASAAAEHETFFDRQSPEVEAPPTAPVDLDEGRPAIDVGADDFAAHRAEPPADIETAAARAERRRARRRAQRWPLSHVQNAILALVVIDAILVGWRGDIVRALPQTASFYAWVGLPVNLRGLDFDAVNTSTEQHEGVQILVVQGNVVNDGRKTVDVPRLKFIVRNAAQEEIYSWTAVPSRTVLPPGEAVAFHSRLASPPPDGRDLVVRFVTRRDLVAATR
jgi:predicted Zn finger-like uncharacterized protein